MNSKICVCAFLAAGFGDAIPHPVIVRPAARFDVSPPLALLRTAASMETNGRGTSPPPQESRASSQSPPPVSATVAGASIEQKTQGPREPAKLLESFDGLGFGFTGPQGTASFRNPSDNSIAAGPNHIVEIVNSRMAVYTKKGAMFEASGKPLYGPVGTNAIFTGFGGICEPRPNGDAVVRYDQLAQRWLYVMPIFRRDPNNTAEPFAMCYAVSTGADPLGPYHRYEFRRKLFPDYPRPAVWPDGYYNPTSTGDDVIQKHACVADRAKMLAGQPATEQCVIIDGVNFLNNADIDGQGIPPAGAPNIMMASGGTQLKKDFDDDGIYAWKFHVDWQNPANTKLTGPVKIVVAPYHYLCDGQLTSCVPQPDTTRRLDAQGDKIMQRLVYRNLRTHESIVAVHSVNTEAGGGGVRWYEFRLNQSRDPVLYQQGTYAPDGFYRWMASPGMDRQGNIGIGYSFGGTPNFAGQRFAARLAGDPLGLLTFRETVLVKGEASQTNTIRWEDYTTLAMDPSDDCTFWYVGDYLKAGAPSYTTKIGAFRLPGCLRATVSGASYFDLDHDGQRDSGEPGLAGREIVYKGSESGKIATGADGSFKIALPADPAYADPTYTFSYRGKSTTVRLKDDATGVNFAEVCEVRNSGGADVRYWSGRNGRRVLESNEPRWREVVKAKAGFAPAGPANKAYDEFRDWLRKSGARAQLAAAALNVAFGKQDGMATVQDPARGDWPTINALLDRAAAEGAADKYAAVIEKINSNSAMVTPSNPASCGKR